MKTKDTELDISSDYILFGKRSGMQMDDRIIKLVNLLQRNTAVFRSLSICYTPKIGFRFAKFY